FLLLPPPLSRTLLPYTTLFRSLAGITPAAIRALDRDSLAYYLTKHAESSLRVLAGTLRPEESELVTGEHVRAIIELLRRQFVHRSEEHTSELQSRGHLVCRLLL